MNTWYFCTTFSFTPVCLQMFFKKLFFFLRNTKNLNNLIQLHFGCHMVPLAYLFLSTLKECWEEWDLAFLKFWAWNNNSSTASGKTWATHRPGNPEPPSGVSEMTQKGHMENSFQIRHFKQSGSHYDSNFLWTHLQEFQYYDFQIIIAVIFHTDWSSAVFPKGSSNLLSLVFQSSGLERPELWHMSVQSFKGNKMQFLLLALFFSSLCSCPLDPDFITRTVLK